MSQDAKPVVIDEKSDEKKQDLDNPSDLFLA
jgi:hypothetical protein